MTADVLSACSNGDDNNGNLQVFQRLAGYLLVMP